MSEQPWIADTRPRREGCPIDMLVIAIQNARQAYPTARLVRNQVGNLSVMVGGKQVGHIDLTFGQFDDYFAEG